MQNLIFKTNIASKADLNEVKTILDNHCLIQKWTVDVEDVDKVLRVVPKGKVTYADIITLLTQQGFSCADLDH